MTAAPFQRLLHLGNVVVDLVMDVPALPGRGGDVLARGTTLAAGGGFNVMAAAARQGLPVSYGGAHGTGPFGDLARAALAAEGIGVLQPPRPGADTGLVVTVVEDGGERTFLTSPGAEATLNAADLDAVTTVPADIVYLSGYGLAHPANRAALAVAGPPARGGAGRVRPRPAGRRDPAGRAGRLLRRADWLTCNAREATLLSGEDDPARALHALSQRPPWTPRRGSGSWYGPGQTAACLDISERHQSWFPPFPSPRWIAMGRATRTPVFSSPPWRAGWM